jgi:hypothetical protein
VTKVPNLGAVTDGDVLVNVAGWMNCVHTM